jgi:peptide/nickel transport system permease protein
MHATSDLGHRAAVLLKALAHHRWAGFLMRRFLSLVLILVALVLATFFMVRLIPGDPAQITTGSGATNLDYAMVRQQLGLDRPLSEQLLLYIGRILHGDLGTSFALHIPVTDLIGQRIGYSLQLAAVSLLAVMLVSVPAGMLAGAFTRNGSHPRGEVVFTAATSIVGSVPEFLAGTFLAFIFAVWLRILPVAGVESWDTLILPTLAIALRPTAVVARIVRVETLNVLAMDYIRTARSKRLPARLVYLRHTLPNVLTAALTVGGLLFAGLIGGAVIVENVFARPGLGTGLVNAVLARDYPVIQGITLVLGFGVVVVNTLVDIALALVDPRSLARQQ